MTRTSLALVVAALAGCGGSAKPLVSAPGAGGSTQVATDPPQGAAGSATAAPPQIATDGGDWGIMGAPNRQVLEEYRQVVSQVANMVTDSDTQSRVQRRSLHMVNVMWEDTGRSQGSSVGPNISDLTLQVRVRNPEQGWNQALMPVIRFPNFSDRTGDIPSDKFLVRVGNEHGKDLQSVPLTDVLRDLRKYASAPSSLVGSGSLIDARDTHFLVSAQAVFLPIPKEGKAEFNPVLFNYQSSVGAPAVLTLLVTREGTSMKVIENRGEDATSGGGQELYFNNGGQRTAFTAERKSDVEARIASQGGPRTEADRSALAKGADVLFLVQVPLKHREQRTYWGGGYPPAPSMAAPGGGAAAPMKESAAEGARSDVEQAVLGHGPNLGAYREGTEAKLERDPRFPIRVTVQFYKATSNGVVSEADLDGIARSIGSVYEHADSVGSLVVPQGDPRRPTAWQRIPGEWFPW